MLQFTEAESNMQDLVAEYQQYQDATYVYTAFTLLALILFCLLSLALKRKANMRRNFPSRKSSRHIHDDAGNGERKIPSLIFLPSPFTKNLKYSICASPFPYSHCYHVTILACACQSLYVFPYFSLRMSD
jgi:hypothetical protein